MKTIRRRRRENKTDYKSRLALLKSEVPRLVIRKTNRYLIASIVQSDIAQDRTLFSTSSKSLLQFGWPESLAGSLKSRVASYLTGFYLGVLAKEKIKEAILDIGLNVGVKESRIFSALKGTLDAGIKIPHKKEIIPSDKTLSSNEKTNSLLNKVKEALLKNG